MLPHHYCPICGKRIVYIQNRETFDYGTWMYTVTYYISDSTEPACLGHDNTPPPVKVPQAFYDAFSDEEVQL